MLRAQLSGNRAPAYRLSPTFTLTLTLTLTFTLTLTLDKFVGRTGLALENAEAQLSMALKQRKEALAERDHAHHLASTAQQETQRP